MRVLFVVVAWILAINVAYAAWLALSEFIGGRRARRELGTLPAMWQLRDLAHGASRRRTRALVAGFAVVILGGVALASPARNGVVATVGDVIADLRGAPGTGERAAHDEEGASSTAAASTREPSPSTTPNDDPSERFRGDRDAAEAAASAPVTGPAASPGQASPPDEQAPPPASSPTAVPSTEPSPTPPAVVSFWSSADAVSATEIRVEWERVVSATSYEVHRSDGAGATVLVDEVPAGKREVTAEGLSPGTAYDFTVTAQSPGGVVATSAASATTPQAAES